MAERAPLAVGVKLAIGIEQLDCGCSKFEQLLPAEKSPAFRPCKEITGESGNAPMSDRVTGIGALKVPTLTVPKLMLFTETVNAVLGVGRNTYRKRYYATVPRGRAQPSCRDGKTRWKKDARQVGAEVGEQSPEVYFRDPLLIGLRIPVNQQAVIFLVHDAVEGCNCIPDRFRLQRRSHPEYLREGRNHN